MLLVERTQTHINTIQEAGVPELADYFQSTVGMSDVSYNKDTKTLVFDTTESSNSENIIDVDAKLAKNSKLNQLILHQQVNANKALIWLLLLN